MTGGEESMQYQNIVLTTPDNITKPFGLNELFQSLHKKRSNF
ncbi:hypothetical protein [Candidatus Enterovibrio altilux]|nr:hypothetical protein [Candidatus Enterovibrio luxaltus]